MKAFWNHELNGITQLALPDQQLVDAYKAGFAYTQIDRSGNALDTGTNGYHAEYEHDVIGILANMFNEGYFTDAHALLDETDRVVGTNTQYSDGTWVYPWLWAVYVEKTGDTRFLSQHFSLPGPLGTSAQPSIEATAQIIAADRTGPGGIIGQTNDIDANGYWTSDNYEALLGLAGYEYLAKVVGDKTQEQWGAAQYSSLLKAVNSTLTSTVGPATSTTFPARWSSPTPPTAAPTPRTPTGPRPASTQLGLERYLLGVPVTGPAGGTVADWLDKTLSYGFGRRTGLVPANTFGGYPGEGFWSTAYNGAYGAWGLASNNYRDEGILSLEFLISNDQAGPYAWWEGCAAPGADAVDREPPGRCGGSPRTRGALPWVPRACSTRSCPRRPTGPSSSAGASLTAGSAPASQSPCPTSPPPRPPVGATITTNGVSVTLKLTGRLVGTVASSCPPSSTTSRRPQRARSRRRRRGHHIREHPLGDGRDGARTGVVTRYQVVSEQSEFPAGDDAATASSPAALPQDCQERKHQQ